AAVDHHSGLRTVAQRLVEVPHRLVVLVALGLQPFQAGRLCGGDLGELERTGDAETAPRAADRGEPVEGAGWEDVERGRADDLVDGEGKESELGAAAGPVDLVGAPLREGGPAQAV